MLGQCANAYVHIDLLHHFQGHVIFIWKKFEQWIFFM